MIWNGKHGEGAMRLHREKKRAEAVGRAAVVRHEDTRAHREGRCRVLHEIFEEQD